MWIASSLALRKRRKIREGEREDTFFIVVEGKEKRQTRKDRFRFSRNRKRKKTKRKTEFTLLKVIE